MECRAAVTARHGTRVYLAHPGYRNVVDRMGKIQPANTAPTTAAVACWHGSTGRKSDLCFMLARYRLIGGSLTRAALLSARNDALANVAIIGAGIITAYNHSAWPDLIVGSGIAALNADAAREVWSAARAEHGAANSPVS